MYIAIPPPFNDVYVDKQRIIQVFSNILSNAIKFSPKNTTVDINAYYYQDDYARIEFHDKGKGIPKEFKEDIFNKFVQHDVSNIRKTSGTGLGLYISKALIEKHEGQISFESTPNAGTKFYVDIPLISNLLRVAHAV